MIEINLLPGPKKRKRGAGFSMPDLADIVSSVKDPLLIGVVVAWVVAGSFIGGVGYLVSRRASGLEPALNTARREARNYGNLIAQKRRMELLRDSLIVELDAIRNIDADRYVWPHLLSEITQGLPQFTWLVAIDNVAPPPSPDGIEPVDPPVRFSLEGRTADIQAYTRFVRQLEDSPWIADIQLGATSTVVEDERPVTSFQVEGTYVQADSAYIRTVPVTEIAR